MRIVKACAALVCGTVALAAMFYSASAETLPVYTAQVVAVFPHDSGAFTQGLFIKDGSLYEGTGLRGHSSIRKTDIASGKVLQTIALPPDMFGEGITDWNDTIVGLTWTEQTGFVFDLKSLKLRQTFTYAGEGWGLTRNASELIMSDGSAELRFLDPKSLRELRRLRVTADGRPVTMLNELEWVEGEIYANVWQTDRIARISPQTGKLLGWIDLAGLLPERDRVEGYTDVLNGIAYDPASKRLFVTGKLWPKLFEIKLVEKPR